MIYFVLFSSGCQWQDRERGSWNIIFVARSRKRLHTSSTRGLECSFRDGVTRRYVCVIIINGNHFVFYQFAKLIWYLILILTLNLILPIPSQRYWLEIRLGINFTWFRKRDYTYARDYVKILSHTHSLAFLNIFV